MNVKYSGILRRVKLNYSNSVHFIGNKARREEAKRIYKLPCCRDKCLHLIGKHRACETIESCLEEVSGLGKVDKHQYLLQKLRNANSHINQETGT